MSIEKSPFASKFEELAKTHKLSFREVSRRIGVSPALITRVLKSDLSPTSDFVEKVADLFDLVGQRREQLVFMAEISQEKIVIQPRTIEQAERAVAFKRAMESESN